MPLEDNPISMGICLSCLKARDKSSSSSREGENQPLLADGSNTEDADGIGAENDELSQQRQQDLANIVQATQELFIDVSGIPNTEATNEPSSDLSELAARLAEQQNRIPFSIPEVHDLDSEDNRRIQEEVEAMARSSQHKHPQEVSQAS